MRLLAIPFWLLLFALGLLLHFAGGRTPKASFHAMRRLYGPTNGLFNSLAVRVARRLRPGGGVAPVSGFLGDLGADAIADLVRQLDDQGYVIFDRRMPAAICDELLSFAERGPAIPMGSSAPVAYADDRTLALRYDFPESAILANPAACRIALDGTLATIAGAYFRCLPIYDFTAMWWTTRFGTRDLSAAAQEFHFDMDRLHFLKFFVYLTDVTEQSGPHVFVAGSHRSKPRVLREPERFDDELVESHYPAASIKRICGPRGTVFAVDTKGLHKGEPILAGDRLAFQVEFTTSTFGQNYPGPEVGAETLRAAGIALPLDRRVYGNVRVRAPERATG